MRGQVSFSFLLVLLCICVYGWTRTGGFHCTQREGPPLTLLMDAILDIYRTANRLEKVLNSVYARFPCVSHRYNKVILDYADTNETITNDKSEFLKSITKNNEPNPSDNDYYSRHAIQCNQSLLYGLKRALEISPAESLILVYTIDSMVDYNDTQLLSEVNTLLEKKKSQVYFLTFPYYFCFYPFPHRDVMTEISFLSYGKYIFVGYTDNYKVWNSFKLLLSKPLNSSVRILNINLNVINKYTEVFSVPTSLTYLLIARDARIPVNFTDPNGKAFAFEKDVYYYTFDDGHDSLSSYLVKSPAAGSWILNAQGNFSLSVQIFGFTGLDKLGNCLDSDCHPNATCSEFGGYGECTCKEGFAGDGTTCNDIDECKDDYAHNCNYYGRGSCVNTIGSFTCNCNPGFKYKVDLGCVDIDECTDSSYNDCDPVAICANYIGSYTCTCPDGYYGDGRHCEVNECQQGMPCGSHEECIKHNGSYSCVDPCSNYIMLNDPWRSTSNIYNNSDYWYDWRHCDYASGWYRFKGEYDQQIPEHCVAEYRCGTVNPTWMNSSHPTLSDGIVNRTVCSNGSDSCCTQPYNISVKMCPEGIYVYKLQSIPSCDSAYCTESNHSCSGLDCAPDEECGIVDGVHGCYCKHSSDTTDGMQPGNVAGKLKRCPKGKKATV